MVAYDQYLKILAEKEQPSSWPLRRLFLTVYFPNQGHHKSRLKKGLKSFFSTNLKNSLKTYSPWASREIISQVEQTVDNLEPLPQGLAFFIKLDLEKKSSPKAKKINKENFIFIPLEKTPQEEFSLGANFDLDQLVWLADKGIDGLVLQINQKRADIYIFDDYRLFLASHQENPFIKKREKESQEQFSPINFQSIFHGTADNIISRREQAENKHFLNSLQTFIKSNANLNESFEYLIINWSSKFTKINTAFPQDLKSFFPKAKLILIDQNITNPKELEKLVIKKTNQEKSRFIEKQLKEAQENFSRYRGQWPLILAAANEDRIQKLFIGPVVNKKGYVTPDNQIYNHPIKNSRLVNNIAPWLVHRVLATGGEIIILDLKNNARFPRAAALMRY
jgi:hypothetical protein